MAGGIGLATRHHDGSGLTGVEHFGPLLRQAAQDAWTEYRPKLIEHLRRELGRGDLITNGVTLYDLDVRVSPDVDLSAERDGNGDLVVNLSTGGNYIEVTCTQPTDLGQWADPRFSFAFGLELSYRIDLPPVTQPLSATGFESIRVLSPKFDSHGVVADVVFVVNDVVKWFSGNDYIAILERFIAGTDFASYANAGLGAVNAKLTELAGQGFWFLETIIDRLDGGSGALHGLSLPGAPADRLELLLTAYGYDRNGVITGEVHWPRSLGEPTNRPEIHHRLVTGLRDFNVATASAILAASPGQWSPIREAAAAAVVLPEQGSPSPVAERLGALAPEAAATTATSIRSAVASSFIDLIGAETFKALQEEFLHGRSDLAFSVTTPVGGAGLFPDMRPAGRLATLWECDDETTCRRRFTIVDVATDAPLTVTCALAPGYRWDGETESVTITADGWIGTVTVRPVDRTLHERVFDDQLALAVGGRRLFGARSELEERGIIIVGGLVDEVALNPQPLPPRGNVAVNNQPLRAGRVGQLVQDAARVERFGRQVLDVGRLELDPELLHPTRQNPSGSGTVTGLDFKITEFVDPGIR
jgi:hypothetical protein